MKAKDYLEQIRKLDKQIENKLQELDYWRNLATSTTVNTEWERVQTSSGGQKLADAVCRYMQIEDEVNEKIDRLVEVKQEIIATIEKLPTDEYDVLHKNYVQGIPLKHIAVSLDKSISWVASINGNGITHIQAILDERGAANDV